ncbi:hypothetical protein STENM327S_01866 [Streptomyces tendae]
MSPCGLPRSARDSRVESGAVLVLAGRDGHFRTAASSALSTSR